MWLDILRLVKKKKINKFKRTFCKYLISSNKISPHEDINPEECQRCCHAALLPSPDLFPMLARELVVSAGESVEVTLPRSSVELNAFVVPPPPPGETENSYE